MMRPASPLPIPGNLSSSSAEAVLMLIRDADCVSVRGPFDIAAAEALGVSRISLLKERRAHPAAKEVSTIVSVA